MRVYGWTPGRKREILPGKEILITGSAGFVGRHFIKRLDDGRNTFRSEEHTSELQSLRHLVCRPLLEKKKTKTGPGWRWSTASCRGPRSAPSAALPTSTTSSP